MNYIHQSIILITGFIILTVEVSVGYYSAAKNLPLFTPGASDPSLQDKSVQPTLVRFGPNYNNYGAAISKIFQHFNWTVAGVMTETSVMCENSAQSVEHHFNLNNIRVAARIRISALGISTDDINMFWARMRNSCRSKFSWSKRKV